MTRALLDVLFWAALAMGAIVGAGIVSDLAYDAGRAAMHLEDVR